MGEIPTPQALDPAEPRRAGCATAFQGTWGEIKGDLDYDAWRREIVASLRARGDTAVFSHYVAINAVVSHLLGDDRVLALPARPRLDHRAGDRRRGP